jgi:hypothetical protein
MQKITHNKIPELLKGIMSNLITIGAISQFLPDREQERIRRISERESEENNYSSSLLKIFINNFINTEHFAVFI